MKGEFSMQSVSHSNPVGALVGVIVGIEILGADEGSVAVGVEEGTLFLGSGLGSTMEGARKEDWWVNKNMILFFASLKNLKKHEFHFLQALEATEWGVREEERRPNVQGQLPTSNRRALGETERQSRGEISSVTPGIT